MLDPATAIAELNRAFGSDDLDEIVSALRVLAVALGKAGYGVKRTPPRTRVAYERSA